MDKHFLYSVSGTIYGSGTQMGLPGLKVRAYDKDFFRDQLLGDSSTDDNGYYEIKFNREDFTGPIIKLERYPDIFILVFDKDDNLVYSTENSIVVDAKRHTTININLKYTPDRSNENIKTFYGYKIDQLKVAGLNAEEVLSAYKLMRNPALRIKNAEKIKEAFPGIFQVKSAPPECGNGIHELFRMLLKERNAEVLFDDAEADPYNGATVKQFFTANIVVNFSTDTTLPDGSSNPNMLPAGSALIPGADANYTMPDGTLIGVVRHNLADLDAANTAVAPTYIQKVGLLAEYALSHYISPQFAYLDPRGGLSRLEFRILGLPTGVAGYAVSSDFHMELNVSNPDSQNLGTVPHELFHLVQYRYNGTGNVANGIRQCIMEGGARLLEESINETPNRYVESANEGDLSATAVPRKGLFNFPGESLLDVGGTNSLLRYSAGLFWKYIAEQHSTHTGAGDEPAIGVDSYRTIIEQMTPAASGFTIAGLRNGRANLPWYGSFDQFSFYDAAATELNSHETTWGNFLLANYMHKLWNTASPGFDSRFAYLEDNDAAGTAGVKLNTLSPAILPGNAFTISQSGAVTKNVIGHKPYAAVYYEITPDAASLPRMLRIGFSASAGMTDPVIQVIRQGAGNSLVDIHRSDRTSYTKTINMSGLSKLVVIVASKETGGNFTLHFDEQASASDIMVTRWNSRVATEYEVNPRGWAWTWISPDIMVDTDNDGLDDVDVFFGHDNKLKVRLRNRGNADVSNIQINFWYQKATPYLNTASWIPVQNAALVTQQLNMQTLNAGADNWFSVDWCPVDDGTHHPHWCVKVAVTCPGDPNQDNKIAFRNFNNLSTGSPDTEFLTMIRYSEWGFEKQMLQIIPRGSAYTLKLLNPEVLPAKNVNEGICRCSHQVQLDAPDNLGFAKFAIRQKPLKKWDGVNTLGPGETGHYYPVDKSTLPPGINPDEIITVAHTADGAVIGGVSYRIAPGKQ